MELSKRFQFTSRLDKDQVDRQEIMSELELPSERSEIKEDELMPGETWEDRGRQLIEESGLDGETITNLLQIFNS